MKKSLASRGVEKVYLVKKYKNFPVKEDNDQVMKEYNKVKEAAQGVKYYSRRGLLGERFYVMDKPHEHKEATEKQDKQWSQALKSCGL